MHTKQKSKIHMKSNKLRLQEFLLFPQDVMRENVHGWTPAAVLFPSPLRLMRWQERRRQAPPRGLDLYAVHHLARRRRSRVRRIHRCQGQPPVEELGLRDGKLGLDEGYLLSCRDLVRRSIFSHSSTQKISLDLGGRRCAWMYQDGVVRVLTWCWRARMVPTQP